MVLHPLENNINEILIILTLYWFSIASNLKPANQNENPYH